MARIDTTTTNPPPGTTNGLPHRAGAHRAPGRTDEVPEVWRCGACPCVAHDRVSRKAVGRRRQRDRWSWRGGHVEAVEDGAARWAPAGEARELRQGWLAGCYTHPHSV